jgi:hypothetical protein
MSPKRKPSNIAASVRARLLNLARQRRAEFQLVLSDFATERLLYRLGISPYADRFILKGAMLFRLWSADPYRATWDLDLLGRGVSSIDAVVGVVRDLCAIPAADGLSFDPESIAGSAIRAPEECVGVRVKLVADLAGAHIPMQIDVGFGDAVVPAPRCETYPTLLDHPPPRIFAYPREAVVAEKLEAITTLGVTNSRMKDFYDLHLLATQFRFEGLALAGAIRATFDRRNTPIPDPEPFELSRAFLTTPERRTLWNAFWKRSRTGGTTEGIEEIADILQRFLGPVLAGMAHDAAFSGEWEPGGPWR